MNNRTPEMQETVEALSPHPEAWKKPNICAVCGGPATVFADLLSQKEYKISRMCQQCQDGIFGVGH